MGMETGESARIAKSEKGVVLVLSAVHLHSSWLA